MAKNPLTKLVAGFKNPAKRPRYLIWTGVVVLAFAGFLVFAFGFSSTYWFCASACHSVQGDAVAAYNQGTHNMVNCLVCHEPVNGDPLIFTYRKAEAGIIGGYQLATHTYSSPLNPESELALNRSKLDFSDDHCTQCHNLDNRKVTPSEGIIINHDAHSDRDINCTACHNRVAHPEDGLETIARNPKKPDEPAAKHANFLTMTACFRCHTLTAESPAGDEFKAPGSCATCHPADFDLKPPSHKEGDFYPKKHADLAMMEVDHATGRPGENIIRPVVFGESEEASAETSGEAESKAEGEAAGEEAEVLPVPPVQDVDYCATCHVKETFCMNCHGMEMPHPESFKTKDHPAVAAAQIDKCEFCHQQSTTFFCDSCHHGTKVGTTFDPAVAWQNQHAKVVVDKGVTGCLGSCHEQQFCVDCHTQLKPVPTSHQAADWLHGGLTVTAYPDGHAAPTASHAKLAQQSIEACDVCHGPGGVQAAFCQGCHQTEMPHPDQFKTNHVSARNNPGVCKNCHQQAELCSDCHHKGAVNGTPWQKQHPVTVAADGAAPCFEKCHQDKTFCVNCHTTLKAVPSSHTTADWTRRTDLAQPAKHQVAYKAATDACDYCHGDGGVQAAFCQNCHQLAMPHAANYKDSGHQADMKSGVAKAVCQNCHTQQVFCDNCHHTGAVADQPWRTYHPNIVAKSGAQPCFECHDPTYCSHCHVGLSRQ